MADRTRRIGSRRIAARLGAALGGLRPGALLDRRLSREFLRPRPELLAEPSDLGLAFEAFELRAGRAATVHGWVVHGDRSAEARGAGTVIHCHGSAANITFFHPYYTFLAAAGFDVVLFDYRGYGKSRGRPSVRHLADDAEIVLDHVLARPELDASRVAMLGTSLGALVASSVAAERSEVRALVIESAPSPEALLTRRLGSAWLARRIIALASPRDLEPASTAARSRAPKLFLCGALDPFLADHLAAAEAASGVVTSWVLPATEHAPDALLRHGDAYRAAIVRFLRCAFGGAVPRVEARVEAAGSGARIELRGRDLDCRPAGGDTPVEVALAGDDGVATFVRTWLPPRPKDFVRVIEVESAPRWVAAFPFEGHVVRTLDTWYAPKDAMARAEDARIELEHCVASLEADGDPLPAARAFADAVTERERVEPLAPMLVAELADSFIVVARVLLASPSAADRSAGRELCERLVAAEPRPHGVHYWPCASYRAGFESAAAIAEARSLIRQ